MMKWRYTKFAALERARRKWIFASGVRYNARYRHGRDYWDDGLLRSLDGDWVA